MFRVIRSGKRKSKYLILVIAFTIVSNKFYMKFQLTLESSL